MARVICTLPNASTEISGVKFTEDKGQMVSEEISDAEAKRFSSIKGYILVGARPAAAKDGEKRGPGRPPKPKDQTADDGTNGEDPGNDGQPGDLNADAVDKSDTDTASE